MAQITVYVNYVIFFQDLTEYQNAVAIAGSPILEMCPAEAAALFGIPYGPLPSGDMADIPKGMYTLPPYAALEGVGTEIGFPNPSGIFMDPSVGSVLVPGQAGSPASIFPAGPDGLHVWSATIIQSVGNGSALTPPLFNIAQRRWAYGFETASGIEGNYPNPCQTRDASRTVDGLGWATRGGNSGFVTQTINEYRAGLTTATSWERFYFRPRRVGASSSGFWRCTGNLGPSAGFSLLFEAAGTIRGFSVNNGSVFTDRGVVFTPTIGQWYKIDILLKYGTGGGTNGRIVIYINGTFAYSFTDTVGDSLNVNTQHISSQLGKTFVTADPNLEYDLDDWINSDLPGNCSPTTLNFGSTDTSIDFLLGSHVRQHFSVSATQVNWTPANGYGLLNMGMNPTRGLFGTSEYISATSNAQLIGLSDALLQSQMDSLYSTLGVVSGLVSQYGSNSANQNGQLGYSIAGGALVLTVVGQGVADAADRNMYLPTGVVLPAEVSPFSAAHQHSATADTERMKCLAINLEYIGVWGVEDNAAAIYPVYRSTNIHNCQYNSTQWGYTSSDPAFPVYAVGGTYVGNGQTQTIILPAACHFLLIRRTSSGEGIVWFGTDIGVNSKWIFANSSWLRVFSDFAGVFKVEITTNEISVNFNGSTYQYIAFCDPGMRFNLTGAYLHASLNPTTFANPLVNTNFLANAGFVRNQQLNGTGGTNAAWYKGPGIGSNNAVGLNGAISVSNFMNFTQGFLNTLTNAHFSSDQQSYSLWRTADSGVGGCTNVMVQILTYTGNGVNPRVISLTPASGRMPLFVMVVDTNGNGRFRDPSHAGINDALLGGWTNSGGGGIESVGVDSITVNGAALNTNGTVYSVFAICGAVGGMLNGTYFPTYCVPTGGPRIPPSPPTADIIVIGDGGLSLNGTVPLLMLQDISGIYTLVPGKLNDTLQDRLAVITDVEVPILPIAKTGYIGG